MDWKKEAFLEGRRGCSRPRRGKAMGPEEDSVLEVAKVTPQAHRHSATPPSSQGQRQGCQQETQVGPAGRREEGEGEDHRGHGTQGREKPRDKRGEAGERLESNGGVSPPRLVQQLHHSLLWPRTASDAAGPQEGRATEDG